MDGDVEHAPDLLPWVDIENIQRFPGIFEPGEVVVLTEKLHGSACLLTYFTESEGGDEVGDEGSHVQVSSKGFGAKSLALKRIRAICTGEPSAATASPRPPPDSPNGSARAGSGSSARCTARACRT